MATPQKGFYPPLKFIPLAEECDLMEKLNDWLLFEASNQIKKWRQQFNRPFYVSVNISAKQLHLPYLAESIQSTMEFVSLPTQALKVEITEDHFLGENSHIKNNLDLLKALGVDIYIDDFGMGYSALNYLQRLPLSSLKIDRSFVKELGEEKSLVEGIIGMAQPLKLQVIAEGIETEAQLKGLRALGCDYGQGHFFAKPMDATNMTKWLEEHL
ncbi:MAG: EAL domain-containing protein [Deinococcales bacterium]